MWRNPWEKSNVEVPANGYDYIIYTDGTNVYAKNGKTGEVEFSFAEDYGTLGGVYEVLKRIVKSNVSIKFIGGEYKIKQPWTGYLGNVNNVYIDFGGATIKYEGEIPTPPSSPWAQYVLGFSSIDGLVLKNLTIDTTNTTYDGGDTKSAFKALWISDVKNALIENVKIYHNSNMALQLGATSPDNFGNVVVRNSVFINYDAPNSGGGYDSGGNADDTIGTFANEPLALHDVIVGKNYVENLGSWSGAIGLISSERITIKDNFVFGGRIYFTETIPQNHIKIQNNYINTNKKTTKAIDFNNSYYYSSQSSMTTAGDDIIIQGNTCIDGMIHIDSYISDYPKYTDVQIKNNYINTSMDVGMFLRYLGNIQIIGNTIAKVKDTYKGMLVFSFDKAIIMNNIINSDDNPIYAGPGNMLLENNVFTNNTQVYLSGVKLYKNSSTATFSGDGSTTQFKIAHGLVSTPSKARVTPMSADAASEFYVTTDATYIYVNYKTAPPSGTNNVVLSWYAGV